MQESELQVKGEPFYVLGREVFHPITRLFGVHIHPPDFFGKPLDTLFSWVYYWRVSDLTPFLNGRFFVGENSKGVKLAYWSRENHRYHDVYNPCEEAMAASANGKIARAYSNNINWEGRLELSTSEEFEKYHRSPDSPIESRVKTIKTTIPGLESLKDFFQEFLERGSQIE